MSTSRINFVVRMQHWMDSVPGQTFLNYAYSWGASIVILGTLFKLTHLPGANAMLFVGMGTEVVVFFLSAFDRPFDKQEIGRELESDYLTDEEIEEKLNAESSQGAARRDAQPGVGGVVTGGSVIVGNAVPASSAGEEPVAGGAPSAPAATAAVQGGVAGGAGSTIIIGSPSGSAPVQGVSGTTAEDSEAAGRDALDEGAELTPSRRLQAAADSAGITAGSLVDIIQMANEELLRRAQASLTPELEQASKDYAEKLRLLTETLDRVEQQSSRLTTDSEEMTNLNRTLTGINTVYELQLKSVSKQIGSIDRINEQTRHMAEQIEELNGIYARMIKALTVNMKNAAGQTGA